MRLVLRDAHPSATRDGLPRSPRGLAARDRARRGRESRSPDVGRHRLGAAGARGRGGSLGRRRSGVSHALSGQSASSVAGRRRRCADRRRMGALLVRPLRRRLARLLRPLPGVGRRRPRGRDHAAGLHRLRLLQPLVAVRLDAGHVGRAPRRDRRRDRRLRRVRDPRLPSRVRSARHLGHRSAPPARVRHGRAPSCADDHRATVDGLDRGARQGGADRRRRRRGTADPPRDAAEPVARLHADRARRRRPAQEEPPAPRHPRPRHDGRAPRAPARAAPGRAPHRDSVGLGRRARADRRDGARRKPCR